MPQELKPARRKGKELFFVVSKPSGKKHSLEPLPKARAEAQMRALQAAEAGYTMGKKPSKK